MRSTLATVFFALSFASAACGTDTSQDPEGDYYEGVAEDENNVEDLEDGKSDIPRYALPMNLPQLVRPEIIVSLKGLTVHLFDRETGFSAVYPAGPGVLGANGISITPRGHFRTSPDLTDTWYYVARRNVPDYFGGFPFLRIDAKNSAGAHTYALHGPITPTLIRGYVSHGCVRMESTDIINLFWMVKRATFGASTPVTIQQEYEIDARGRRVNVGRTAALFAKDVAIPYGASVGPRPF